MPALSSDDSAIHRRKYLFLLVSALSAFIGTLDGSIVNISLPTLSREFNVSIDIIAWVVLAYSLAISANLLLVGRLAALKGYRFTYTIGFWIFTAGSLLCGLSVELWQIVVFRALQGIGAAFLMAAGPALIRRAFPANERGKGMGILGTVVGVGLMSGPPLGGLIVSTIGWRWIFFLNIPVGIFGAFYASRLLKPLAADDPESRVDYPAWIYQAVAIIALLLFCNRINDAGIPRVVLLAILALSIIAFTMFIRRERSVAKPLLGLAIFKHREFSLAILSMLIVFISTSSGLVLIPFYLENILDLIPSEVGLVLVTIPICTIVIAPLAGRIADTIGFRLLTTLGVVLIAIGMFFMSRLDAEATRFDFIIRLVIIGIGGGMFQPPNSTALMSAIPRRMAGVASGLLALARTIGFAIGIALSTAVFSWLNSHFLQSMASDDAFVTAFHWTVSIFAAFVCTAIVTSFLRRNRVPLPIE